MKTGISIKVLGHTASLFLLTVYVLCVTFDLLLPEYAMYESWQVFLPGFEWINLQSFIVGLIESYAYGWLLAVVWGSIYNLFAIHLDDSDTNNMKTG